MPDTRLAIRTLVDRAVRARIQAFIDSGELVVCSKCGCETDEHTTGCRVCSNRHWGRLRRSHNYNRSSVTHGLSGSYVMGCRCDECRIAYNTNRRERYRRKRASSACHRDTHREAA